MDSTMNTAQPKPKPTAAPAVWDLVMADMRERDAIGKDKYGTRLQAFNGRDALVDAYQEALDLAVYLRQAIYERDGATTGIKRDFNMATHPDQSIDFKVYEIELLRRALLAVKAWDVENAFKTLSADGAVSFALPEDIRRQVQDALGAED